MSLYCEYRENPGKPELVLLHGWGMSSDVWGEFADHLAKSFSLTLIDLPGLGRSTDSPNPYTTEAVIQSLLPIVPEKASWLGWSMGGQIAISFAASYPEKIEKLITVASNPCFVQRADWNCAMEEGTHQQFEQSLAVNIPKTLTRFAMLQTQGADLGRETLKMLKMILAGVQHQAPVESLGLLREDVRQELSGLNIPVLQLFGEKDLLVPQAAAAECAMLTGKPSIIYSGAGHLPFFSHMGDVLDDVTAFLAGKAA